MTTLLRGLAAVSILGAAGCSERIQIVSAWRDASGHRLYLFSDSSYVAQVGPIDEMLNRRAAVAYGRWDGSLSDSLILRDGWPQSADVHVKPDTPATQEFMVRLKDRNGLDLASWSGNNHISLIDENGQPLHRSIYCRCFFASSYHPWLILFDSSGIVPTDTLRLMDTGNRRFVARVDWDVWNTYPNAMRIADLSFKAEGGVLKPQPYPEDRGWWKPGFLEMDAYAIERKERRAMERVAQNKHR